LSGPDHFRRTVEAIWRIESPRLIAVLVRRVGDVGIAEELAQNAFVAALEQWPTEGIPDHPGSWLMACVRHRGIDHLRRTTRIGEKHEELAHEVALRQQARQPDFEAAVDDDVGDDLLRLVFICCHPVVSPDGRSALTLRLLGGLQVEEIARAFVVSSATIAQRIVRAKRALAEAGGPFEVPRGEALRERLASVLEVVYLVFNEGYAAAVGDDWLRPALCDDALRLGRVLAGLMPDEPEVHGLVALMEIQASRARARVSRSGEPILLLDQDRAMWDQLLIRRGLAALARAETLGGAHGAYTLQAAIAACHARAAKADATPWPRIAALYARLTEVSPSPIVELNRAVALSMAFGPATGLRHLDDLPPAPALERYHLFASVRADFLFRLGRFAEARAELGRALELTANERERTLLRQRAAECDAR
jgi:RNA polymerase sigma factor (sigma-70 family)